MLLPPHEDDSFKKRCAILSSFGNSSFSSACFFLQQVLFLAIDLFLSASAAATRARATCPPSAPAICISILHIFFPCSFSSSDVSSADSILSDGSVSVGE